MIRTLLLSLVAGFCLASFNTCTDGGKLNEPLPDKSGSVIIKFEKNSSTQSPASLVAVLTRTGYETLTSQIVPSSTSTTEITINSITPGIWHLKITGLDQSGAIIYSGETDVNILSGSPTQISLMLQPVSGQLIIDIGFSDGFFHDNASNPVFTNARSPQLPNAGVASSFLLYIDGKYKMWYTNWYGNSIFDVQYAESSDGINWTGMSNNPVIKAGQFGNQNSFGVYGGPVIYENGQYKMFFTAIPSDNSDSYIGLATSADGISWNNAIIPIISEPGKKLVADAVIKNDGRYYLYYSYTNYLTNDWGISLSISTDGINWNRYAEKIMDVTPGWELPGLHFPTVIYLNNEYKMIYGSLSCQDFGYATSPDGLNWTKSNINPFITPSMTSNNWTTQLRYPNFIKVGDELRLYYTGMQNGILEIGFAKMNF
jgi:predicted GH43/DUF377 family glycosyl hydrolase